MSNVVEFRKREKTENVLMEEYDVRLTLIDGELDTVSVLDYDDLTVEDRVNIAHNVFKANWWLNRDISGKYDDSRDLLCQVAIYRGGGTRVFSPGIDHPDSFQTEEQQAWLRRKMDLCYEMALPSWSEEPPASGTTSQSHSAISDQLSFSW